MKSEVTNIHVYDNPLLFTQSACGVNVRNFTATLSCSGLLARFVNETQVCRNVGLSKSSKR
jgi:hypothetical protein